MSSDDIDYIEPPPDEAAAYAPPPSLEHHEDLTTARLAGYSWPEIDGDLQQRTATAYRAGYTQQEIDAHLGYIEPQGLQTDLDRYWQQQVAADPTLVTGLVGAPRSALTPLDGLSAARVAEYAGLPPPAATDAIGDENPSPLSLYNDDLRGRYVDALLTGETRSPLDFAERAAGAFLGVGADLGGTDPAPTAAHAARDLATNLPSNADLTDVAIGLGSIGGGVPLTPGMVAVIKDNLADVWARTSAPLMDIYRSASQSPELLDALVFPKPAPIRPFDDAMALGRIAAMGAESAAAVYDEPLAGGREFWGTADDPTGLRTLGYVVSKDLAALSRIPAAAMAGIAMSANQLFKEVGLSEADANRTMRDAIALAAEMGGRPIVPKIRVVDPLAKIGETIQERVPATEAFPVKSPINAVAEQLATEATIGENIAAKVKKIEALESERMSAEADVGTSTFFQRKLAEMGEEAARGVEPTTEEVIALAEGHQTARGLFGTIGSMLDDIGGAGLNPFTTKLRDADRTAYLSPAYLKDFGAARDVIREYRGSAERTSQQAFAALEQYRRDINKHLPEFEKQVKLGPAGNIDDTLIGNLYNYMEGRSAEATLKQDSPFAPVANVIRTVNQDLAGHINASGHGQAFIDDYFVHMWQDARAARTEFGVGRQGNANSLKQRDIPTISEGLARGLQPKILDPIEAQLHYTAAMTRHLGWQDILGVSENAGYVEFHPPGAGPADWVKLNGVGAKMMRGPVEYNAYAPPGFASAYNRAINTGWYDSPIGGAIYDKLRFVANGMTAAKLAFSGYHAFNIVKESIAADLTMTLGKIGYGDLAGGLKQLALTPFAPIRQAYRGGQITKQYLGVKDYGPEMADIVDALTGANMRMTGRQAVYRVGNTPSIIQSLSRGTLGRELVQDVTDVFGKDTEARAFRIAAAAGPRLVGLAFKETGRVLDTLMGPLFDKYIPAIKNAAAFDEMQAWMKANPTAAPGDLLRMARKVSDSMDDRFGEMNQDNLFWNQKLKQSINLGVVSLGWEWGSLRAFLGAGKDILNGEFNSTRARWLMSYPMTVGIMAAAYQYLKTGEAPQQPLDLALPKTGGMKGSAPEQIIMPGYEKDVFQWYKALQFAPDFIGNAQNFADIAKHKGNPFTQSLVSTFMTGTDGLQRHIRNLPNAPHLGVAGWELPPGIANYLKFYADQFVPIPFQQPRFAGSNISDIERFLGFRQAPSYMTDPEGFAAKQAKEEARHNKEELDRAKWFDKLLENPVGAFEPAGPLPQRRTTGGRQSAAPRSTSDPRNPHFGR